MKFQPRLASLVLLALAVPLSAHADDASRRLKAAEMVRLLHVDRSMTQITDNIMKQTTQLGQQLYGPGTPPPEKKAALEAFQKKILATMDAEIGWKTMEPEYVKLYAATYTDEEFDAILAFYKSPAGVSLIEKAPGVSQQAAQMVQGRLAVLQPELKQMLEDFIKSQKPEPAPATSTPPTLNPPGKGTPK